MDMTSCNAYDFGVLLSCSGTCLWDSWAFLGILALGH